MLLATFMKTNLCCTLEYRVFDFNPGCLALPRFQIPRQFSKLNPTLRLWIFRQIAHLDMLNLKSCSALADRRIEDHLHRIAGGTFNLFLEVGNTDAHSEILRT